MTSAQTSYTIVALVAFTALKAGPMAIALFAIGFGIGDVSLRALRIGGRFAYTAVCGPAPLTLLLASFALVSKDVSPSYYIGMLLPGGLLGAAVLGGFRAKRR